MTTLTPRPPYSEEELARLYPKELELKQVQVLLRHGERTPVSSRFKNAGLPQYWPYCQAAARMRSTIMTSPTTSWDELTWRRQLEVFGSGDGPTLAAGKNGEIEAVCLPGELTDRGRHTTLALGQRLRHLYIDQLGFLPVNLDQATQARLHLRATPVPRALESLQESFTGLYPLSSRRAGLEPPPIVTRNMWEETLFPNEGACARFAQLARAFAERAALRWNDSADIQYINDKIGKWMPKDSPVVKVDSHPRLSGIMDTINATLAHGADTRLPKEFYDPQVRQNINSICSEEWFAGYAESDEYRKLGIGALVADITQSIVQKASSNDGAGAPTMALSGCHDTTLGAILVSLGAFEGEKWPNFTSSIAVELFQRRKSDAGSSMTISQQATSSSPAPTGGSSSWWSRIFGGSPSSLLITPAASARTPLTDMSPLAAHKLDDHFVRIRFNDSVKTIPHCARPGNNMDGDASFCTLKAFKEVADSFTPRAWRQECKANLGSIAVPVVPEKALGVEKTPWTREG